MITEVRLDNMQYGYAEVSNRSETDAVDLSQFEFANLTPWTLPYNPDDGHRFMFPQHILWPGESYVIVCAYDLPTKMKLVDPEHWNGRENTPVDLWTLGDYFCHVPETDFGNYLGVKQPDGTALDSVSPHGAWALESWNGRDAVFLRQHLSDIDSVVVDEFSGDYSRSGGFHPIGPVDVAGVARASANSVILRKYSIKEGNNDWQKQQGVDLTDSEWMPIPVPKTGWGQVANKVWDYWTVGNDGNYMLTPDNFVSSTVDINWTDTILTVPWGTRSEYQFMKAFEKTQGLAWVWTPSSNREDSAFFSARTGDEITIYAAGNELQIWPFHIVVAEPTDDANLVVPKYRLGSNNRYSSGGNTVFFATDDTPGGMDTIFNVGFATRVDTLFKYLEKAPAASWEVIPVDDQVGRPDVKDGDLLRVTAKDGSVKDYYIKVDKFIPNHTGYLSAITWPDIPDFYRGIFGWKGDTIPGFGEAVYNYTVQVPIDVDGVPALTATSSQTNGKWSVKRATNLYGGLSDRTVVFTSSAEDDTTIYNYNVVLEKEKAPSQIQPFVAEPFFSQRAHRVSWYGSAMEIANPGNQILDLSHYMLVQDELALGNPADVIASRAAPEDWNRRYDKYIPGRIWQGEAEWAITPALAQQDLAVNPLVYGGDVFTCAAMGTTYNATDPYDVDFWDNPWGDTMITAGDGGTGGNPVRGWHTNTYYLYKILNDSVRNGTKPATDPEDFQLIDVFGAGDGSSWVIGGKRIDQTMGMTRRPQYWHGSDQYNGSFGSQDIIAEPHYPDPADGEWDVYDRPWYGSHGFSWPRDVQAPIRGFGTHLLDPITSYMSTVTSLSYKVSQGYSMNESIKGATTGTTVDQFAANISKADPGQTFVFKSGSTELAGSDELSNNDDLEVTSQDGNNTTKYSIEVTADGLSHDAWLTSAEYNITVDGSMGTITGFDYSTMLATVQENVVVPAGATFTTVDDMDAYVPTKRLNADTMYIDVMANDNTYFEVVAEDGVTTIKYQLLPSATESDAFVTSNVYMVDQDASLIMYVNRGTHAEKLLENLIPAAGASMKLVDKKGYERTSGPIYQDDKIIVTSSDGSKQKVYYLSMLVTRAATGETTDYLAYVLSDVYSVDQVALTIWADAGTDNATFLGNLIPSMGASIVVVNAEGVESTAPLSNGDMLKVTAANGETVVMYQVLLVSAKVITDNNINLYPNPTSGLVNISGIESGNRIRVFNAMGANIRSIIANSDKATFSLDNEPAGMYLIIVDDSQQLLGRFKVIRK